MENGIEFIKEMKGNKFPRKTICDMFYQKFDIETSFDECWEQAHAKPVPEVKEVEGEECKHKWMYDTTLQVVQTQYLVYHCENCCKIIKRT